MQSLSLSKLLNHYRTPDMTAADRMLAQALNDDKRKVVVLDDDPTGIQTVNGVNVYTDWSPDSVLSGFDEDSRMFFILTNSRSFTAEQTAKVHREIALNITNAAKKSGKTYSIVSRGDSTLRGHYPLETEIIRETIEKNSTVRFDGEIIMPFFKEGGRYTAGNVHYVAYDDSLIPAGETEFARDKTFGFSSSDLGGWIEEKSLGKFKKNDVAFISLELLREMRIDEIENILLHVEGFNKIVVNAIDYFDVKVFCIALLRVMQKGRHFLFRTAAAFPKVFGGVRDRPLLRRDELITDGGKNGGLIIIGSHVKKTTEQLEALKSCDFLSFIEFNQHLVLDPPALEKEVARVVGECEALIKSGRTVAVYTRRERLDLGAANKEEELKISVRISDAVTKTVSGLGVRPGFIIAKGGITSSDIGVRALRVKKALAAGQILDGIPVWMTGGESKFPNMPYIIFPGNVGGKNALKDIVVNLCGR